MSKVSKSRKRNRGKSVRTWLLQEGQDPWYPLARVKDRQEEVDTRQSLVLGEAFRRQVAIPPP